MAPGYPQRMVHQAIPLAPLGLVLPLHQAIPLAPLGLALPLRRVIQLAPASSLSS